MGINVVSLFSGGGGLDLGFVVEGYNVIWAIDNNKNATETYKANIGDHIMCADINQIDISRIPHADVVIGGPPCQSFSLAGKRNVEDERGQLVWRYIHIIEQVKPKAFVFENVTGLLSAKNSQGEKIIELLKNAFKEIGYTVKQQVINAADYGIPQRRKRVIIVGLKKKEFKFPLPTHSEDGKYLKRYVSVEEALGDLPDAIADENGTVKYRVSAQNEYQRYVRRNVDVTEHFIPKMSELDEYIVSYVKPGGNYMDIPADVNSSRIRRLQKDGGHTTCYGRLASDKPSYTINTYFNRPNVGCNIHYQSNRLITVREALRLQSFPDDYKIISSSKQGRNLIVGNAVPPMLASVIARELKKYLEEDNPMWISYSDSEVHRFHPICERALNYALQIIGKETQYRVLHHQYTGALEMDYVVQNIATGKYLCVVEVKRTPADVHSARYQFQAMSYVQMNADQSEKPFYILTNLEYAFSFRYDAIRPRVFQQMLEPGISHIGNFDTDEEDPFVEKLAGYFSDRLTDYTNNTYEYLVTLEEFATHMEQIKEKPKRWKAHLAVLLYEYIRGAFTFIKRNELRDIRLFHNDVLRICDEAALVNFKDIFNYSDDSFERTVNIPNDTLVDLYDFGNQNVNGDSVAGILHSIVSAGHEHDGEVPTDLELARIVAELAKYSSGELPEQDLVCDPAAGSGNLISAAIPTYNLVPTQIVVNDINSKLLELLSLRIGLNYANTISVHNSPAIYNRNISDVEPSFFNDVKVVIMNPPFSAGINCVARKQPLYRTIKRLTGNEARTEIGQMPLEAVFLELIVELVQTGTTISCVFPKTHLMGRGSESKAIRRFLLNQFGLHLVFTYPGDEIFDEVTKDTCVIVGKAKTASEYVKVVSSYDKIPDIDTHRFTQTLSNDVSDEFAPIMPGIIAKRISVQKLNSEVEDGWRMLNSEMVDAITFVKETFQSSKQFDELVELDYPTKRGRAGNSGGSDIMFFNSRADLYEQFQGANIVLSVGMRNAKFDSLDIGSGDSDFLDASDNSEDIVNSIIDAYNALPDREGRQQRRRKTKQEWKKILNKESSGRFPANSVLIPRAIRTTGKSYLSRNPVFVSTNFVVCSLPSLNEAIMMSTWMSTVFYQLICEVSSKDQEGMRKMEVSDIEKTYIPKFACISTETVDALSIECNTIEFLNLRNPEIREVDRIWAKELFGQDSEDMLSVARKMLEYLANRRNP